MAEWDIGVDPLQPSGMHVLAHERAWAMCRPKALRTKLPEPGSKVWYRHVPDGPLTEAEVESVDMANRSDDFVYRYVLHPATGAPITVAGKRLRALVDDPWPDVYLRTEWGRIVTREARLAGSPGWLPLISNVSVMFGRGEPWRSFQPLALG